MAAYEGLGVVELDLLVEIADRLDERPVLTLAGFYAAVPACPRCTHWGDHGHDGCRIGGSAVAETAFCLQAGCTSCPSTERVDVWPVAS